MSAPHTELPEDFADLLVALADAEAAFVVVGGSVVEFSVDIHKRAESLPSKISRDFRLIR